MCYLEKQTKGSVMAINAPIKRPRSNKNWTISFSANDVDILVENVNNPIVISTIIDNYLAERILVDDRSAVEILTFDAFKKMRLDESLLMPTRLIYGFTNLSSVSFKAFSTAAFLLSSSPASIS